MFDLTPEVAARNLLGQVRALQLEQRMLRRYRKHLCRRAVRLAMARVWDMKKQLRSEVAQFQTFLIGYRKAFPDSYKEFIQGCIAPPKGGAL